MKPYRNFLLGMGAMIFLTIAAKRISTGAAANQIRLPGLRNMASPARV